MIAIIVPFYQRRTGLLAKAVQSVLNQVSRAPWRLIVVDDGSPLGAEDELAPFSSALGAKLTLLKQANLGVSAARNQALELLDPSTEIVAFLDSDDAWDPAHLERIERAWAAGAEFYFEDSQRHDAPHSWFKEIGFEPADHARLDGAHGLYWYQGDFMDAVLRRSPALTSTVAYKFCAVPGLRFPVGISPGEDTYCWMQAALSLKKVAFSSLNAVALGEGVNVSRGVWGTVGEVKRLLGERRYRRLIGGLPLNDDQRDLNRMAIRGLNVDFWRAVLASTRRGEYRHGHFVRSYLALQPGAIAQLPAALVRSVRAKSAKSMTAAGQPGSSPQA